MTTAYTSLLGLALPVTGELSGTWGNTVNTEITSLLDSAIAGTTTISADADITLTTTTGAANESREAIILWTAGGTTTRNITAPAQSKTYIVINKSSSTQSIVLRGAGPTTGVTIIKGESAVCAWNGSDFIKVSNTSGAGVFSSITNTGLTSGRVVYSTTGGLETDSANLTFNGTILTAAGFSGPLNGTVGATTATTGAFTTLSATGVATFSAGTAALPAITTTGDTNTGIFFPAADTIAFAEGGVERARIDSSGNLGLGVTPSPWNTFTASFQIDGASLSGLGANNTALASNAYYQGGWKYYGTASASLYQQNAGQHAWSIAASGTAGNAITFTQAMTLDSSGNVGIGTSTPAQKLEVSSATNNTVSRLTNTGSNFELQSFTNDIYLNLNGSGSTIFRNGTPSLTERMRLDSSGNLIVGNTTAYGIINGYTAQGGTQLSVLHGGAGSYPKVSGISFGQPTTSITVSNNGGTTTFTGGAGIYANNTASSGNPTSLVFWTNSAGTPTEAMRLDSSGNLGIGTSSPATKLAVAGGIAGTGALNISGAGWGILPYVANSLVIDNNVGETRLFATGADATTDGSFLFYTSQTDGGTNERMRIDSSGNVGIGTSSSSSRLDVRAAAGELGRFAISNTGVGYLVIGGGASTTEGLRLTYDNSDGSSTINNFFNASLKFATNNTERMRISSDGSLLINSPTAFENSATILQTFSSTAPAAEFSTAAGATTDVVGIWNRAASGDNQFIGFYTDASPTRRGSITYNRAGGLVAYNVTSDYRAKDIYGLVSDSGALIDSVPVYMGKMKGATQERPMFIAHETPVYAHTGEKDAVDADGNPVYQQMDASALIPVMWAEIQSLRKRLTALEST